MQNKAFDKIQYLFKTKALRKLGIKENFLNLTSNVYQKLYFKSLTYELVPLQERVCKSNLFVSSTNLAYVAN